MPILTKARDILVSQVARHGSEYTSAGDTFNALLLKADVSQDMPRDEYTILAGYNATFTDGELVIGDGERYVPVKLDIPNTVNASMYKRIYLRQCNASGMFQRWHEQGNASTDVWDQPAGTASVDYGWVAQKNSVYINLQNIKIGDVETKIGEQETTAYIGAIPRSVNASWTPRAGDRFVDTNGDKLQIQDVDDSTWEGQAYRVRFSIDER